MAAFCRSCSAFVITKLRRIGLLRRRGGGGSAPSAPMGLTATAGNQQVGLSWTPSATATSYHVKRSTTTGGPYTLVASPSVTGDIDSALDFGTKYFYVVTAVNSYGESANSSEASATPSAPPVSVHLTVNALDNRHPISPYVYGGSYPKDTATITDSGLSAVRWAVTQLPPTTGSSSPTTRTTTTISKISPLGRAGIPTRPSSSPT